MRHALHCASDVDAAGAGLSTTRNLAGVATFAGLVPVDATNAGHMTPSKQATSQQATSPRATAASAPPHLAIVLFSLAMGGFAIESPRSHR